MEPEQNSNYRRHKTSDESVKDDDESPKEPLKAQETKAAEEQRSRHADPDDQLVRWSAQEYIANAKNPLWFLGFGLIVLGLIALDVFVIRSYTFSVLVVIMSIALVIYSKRKPNVIDYTLSPNQGLYVGQKLYHFDEFKSFGLVKDNVGYSILLIPTKRFMPGVSVYFPQEAGEQIVDLLGSRLPMENLKLDFVDTLVRKLRL